MVVNQSPVQSDPVDAHIALGSNLGDRLQHLQQACDQIGQIPGIEIVARSAIYQTAPMGPTGQGAYLNAAIHVRTTLRAESLLREMQNIEQTHHRQRTRKWGPRTLDLDLLFYGDRIISTPELTVPHPHLHERWFVLQPLSDVAEAVVHPVLGRSVRALLDNVTAEPIVTHDWPDAAPDKTQP